VSGFKVWPRDVEDVIYQHPAVKETAVIGVPDPYRGETVKAFIAPKEGMEAELTVRTEPIADQIPNVLATIPGSDLAHEVVLVMAHYDHLGTAEEGEGMCGPSTDNTGEQDLICNGADDNASGTAMVVELAHAFAGQCGARRGRQQQLRPGVTKAHQGHSIAAQVGGRQQGKDRALGRRHSPLGTHGIRCVDHEHDQATPDLLSHLDPHITGVRRPGRGSCAT